MLTNLVHYFACLSKEMLKMQKGTPETVHRSRDGTHNGGNKGDSKTKSGPLINTKMYVQKT